MKPEMVVRRLLHKMGYRFRLHRRDLPGHPDIIFPSRKKVIFVNGCFWHQHSDTTCKIARLPKSNLSYWTPKLERNKNRDEVVSSLLKQMGWKKLVIWECETETCKKVQAILTRFLN